MKNNLLSFVSLAIALFAIGIHYYRPSPRIAYAETAVLMSEFSEAIKARSDFGNSQKEWDKNLKQINDSLVSSVNRMKTSYEKASPMERSSMNESVEKWNGDLQRYSQAVKKMSEDKEKELMTPVISKMNSFMKTWGDQHGYDIIFGATNAGNLLQANSAFNVTSKLLADLNSHYIDSSSAEKKNEALSDLKASKKADSAKKESSK